MKTKLFFLSLLTAFIYFSCEDSTLSEIGISTMPDKDKIEIFEDTVLISLKTIKTDSVYAKTTSGALGEYYDPTFGTLNAGFACQFYPSIVGDSLHKMIDGKIDSVFLYFSYSFMGDSLNPMELTVYPINKPLEKNYYTTVNPEQFADLSHPVSKFAYTTNSSGMLAVPLPVEWGQKLIDVFKENPKLSLEDFTNMFPGFYIKSTYGSGSLLFASSTAVAIQYRTWEGLDAYLEGGDSIQTRRAYWAVTKEVIQVNSFKNTNLDYLFQNDSIAYIKSPAGVFTELTIPIPEIIQKIGKRQFSSVKLSLSPYPKNEWDYSLDFPGLGYNSTKTIAYELLLIPPDSVKNFFEQQQVANNATAYTTMFNISNYTYNFNNISNLIRYAIDHKPNENLRLWLIPVQASCVYNSNTGGYDDYVTSYDLYPSGVALKGKNQKISIIASDLEINK